MRQKAGVRRNLEIKAVCPAFSQARRRLKELGAEPAGVLHQIDTYFKARRGRLKLREEAGRAELICYARPNKDAARISLYQIAPVGAGERVKRALAAALGIIAVVRKRRELYLLDNVRIHLDTVGGLGKFLELEAVLARGDAREQAISRQRVAQLVRALQIRPDQRLARSYADLATPAPSRSRAAP